MSTQGVAWALDARQTGPLSTAARCVLILLAESADRTGRGAHLSVPTMASMLGITERSVRRSLVILEERQLIRDGDQARAAYLPVDRRPVVRDVALAKVELWGSGEPLDLTEQDGVTFTSPRSDGADLPVDNPDRPDVYGSHDLTYTSGKPTTKPTTPTQVSLKGDTTARANVAMAMPSDPGPPVRVLGDTSPTCPVCGALVHRSHRCRSSAMDPPPPPAPPDLAPVEPVRGQEPLPLATPGTCSRCYAPSPHRPLIDGLCAPCYVETCRAKAPP